MSRAKDESDESLVEGLRALYRDVDAAYATTSCPGTTECCRFGRTGREPYVTALEVELMRRGGAKRGGGAPPRPAPLHETHQLRVVADERPCPLLTRDGRCSIYDARPMGCRTFFCDRATSYGAIKHKELLSFVARLKDLAARFPGGDEGRPLTRVLAEGAALKKPRGRPSNGSRGPSHHGSSR